MSAQRPAMRSRSRADNENDLDSPFRRVGRKETRVLIEQGGEPVAALVAPDDLARLTELEAAEARQAAADGAVIHRLRERNRDADPEQVLRDATEAVDEVRRGMYAEEQRTAARRR